MTSSVSNPSGSGHTESGVAEGQPQVDAYQKYSFFQVHHNRDPVRYRTPYGPGGGFVNGYERNHRAFLIKAQKALNGGNSKQKPPSRAAPSPGYPPLQPRPSPSPQPSHRPQSGYASPYAQILPRPEISSPQSPFSFENGRAGLSQSPVSPYQQQGYSVSTTPGSASCAITQPGSTPLHPAINPQYGTPPQQGASVPSGQQQWAPAPQGSTLAPPPRQGSAKTIGFHKQSHSPIPLPPYVRSKMGSAAITTTPKPKPSPLSRPPEQAVPQNIAPRDAMSTPTHHCLPQQSPGLTTMPNNPFSYSPNNQGATVRPPNFGTPTTWTNDPGQLPQSTPGPTQQQQFHYYQTAPPAQPIQQPTGAPQDAASQPTQDTADQIVQKMMLNLRRASMSLGSLGSQE